MTWNSLRGGVAFAAFAALGLAVWLPLASPDLGRSDAIGLFASVGAGIYLFGLGPWRKRNALAAAAVAGAALAALWVGASVGAVILVATVGISLARAGWLYRSTGMRGIALESVLSAGSLWLAAWMMGPGVLAPALACWAYFLVQALFFLVAGAEPRTGGDPREDAFERARANLVALLEDRA